MIRAAASQERATTVSLARGWGKHKAQTREKKHTAQTILHQGPAGLAHGRRMANGRMGRKLTSDTDTGPKEQQEVQPCQMEQEQDRTRSTDSGHLEQWLC